MNEEADATTLRISVFKTLCSNVVTEESMLASQQVAEDLLDEVDSAILPNKSLDGCLGSDHEPYELN